ncbi:hypothetical protein FAEPRAM212_02641 [Faecalibacterium prausnitzii M21/2]|uniref:Uncharacterized protein n=1 Tax=Faecalibacterium prausnitzii M21/2 TaxID=411485 RepID=A8SF29_9FIRM|nr:hypothetical protein FAEPRAM212_02641 [Faecalibacterium prausnitzii M21/2]
MGFTFRRFQILHCFSILKAQEKNTSRKVRKTLMTIFNVFSLLGGLALFLFGMDIMGKALEKQAGGQLQKILSKLTDNPLKGFFWVCA